MVARFDSQRLLPGPYFHFPRANPGLFIPLFTLGGSLAATPSLKERISVMRWLQVGHFKGHDSHPSLQATHNHSELCALSDGYSAMHTTNRVAVLRDM
jgi:hypothetical protein